MKPAILLLAALALLTAAPRAVQYTGRITDSMCARAEHASMGMGDTDGECTIACVRAHGALYVLFDGKQVYSLGDQTMFERFAGKKVAITGSLDAKTMTIGKIDSIKVVK
ncbi:MAG: hypothetical protein ABI811_24100 [Acidobacteriota bacterium]